MLWRAYQHRRGSFNLGRRLERGFALLAYLYSHRNGGKATMDDYMPHEAEWADGDIDSVAKMLGAVPGFAKGND